MRNILPEYQQRFINEYMSLVIKIGKLRGILDNWDNLNFEPKCSHELLLRQLEAMMKYKEILEERMPYEFKPMDKGETK